MRDSVCLSVCLSECLLLHHAKTNEPNGLKFSEVIPATIKTVIGLTRGLQSTSILNTTCLRKKIQKNQFFKKFQKIQKF